MNDDQSPPPPPEFSERETPTRPGNPKPADDGYDTSFLKDDSTFSQAVKIVAKAARVIEAEREERRTFELSERETRNALLAQQGEILAAIRSTEQSVQQADRNSTANYQMVIGELKLLKQSDANQNSKIAQLEKIPSTMEERIIALRNEIMTEMPAVVLKALQPYVDRLEALEKEDAEQREQPVTSNDPTSDL